MPDGGAYLRRMTVPLTQARSVTLAAGPGAAEALQGGAGAERLLLDAAERALRAPEGRIALALHLSRLTPPAPRPYHTRIALALMQDTAQRLGGQVFPMRNADLVLLCGLPGQPAPDGVLFGLPGSLERLFGVDAPGAALTSLWRLDRDPAPFRTYVAARQAEKPPPARPQEETALPGSLAAIAARMAAVDVRSLLAQQTAVLVRPGRGLPLSARLSPLFRALQLAPDALGAGAAPQDPFSLRHLAASLDARILGHVLADLRDDGPLTRPALRLGMPLHLTLSPEAVVSPGFARLAAAAASRGARFAVALPAMDAAADPALTGFAATLLSQAGFGLVLDGIDHAGLAMIRPGGLAPALVRLAWSPRMADGPPALLAGIDAAIEAIGADRIVLCGADGEAALVWGQARGIARFQGPFLDAVQAAARIAICHGARFCTLRQCTARALALDPGLRRGCGNPGLLDLPPETAVDVKRALRA